MNRSSSRRLSGWDDRMCSLLCGIGTAHFILSFHVTGDKTTRPDCTHYFEALPDTRENSVGRGTMGVGEDFSTFKDNYQISSELIGSISYRYKRITRQLNTDFWNTNSETSHSLYVGSYGRDTAARGLSDLDIAFILPNSEYHKY